MCFSARPLGLTYTLRPVFKKGEVRCVSVLAGVNHCCRWRLKSQQLFVASGAFVLRCPHENRPPTLCCGSTSCFSPTSSLLRLTLNCVGAHHSVFVPSSRPGSLNIVVSSIHLLSPNNVKCWASYKYGGSSEETTWTFFHWSILKKNFIL